MIKLMRDIGAGAGAEVVFCCKPGCIAFAERGVYCLRHHLEAKESRQRAQRLERSIREGIAQAAQRAARAPRPEKRPKRVKMELPREQIEAALVGRTVPQAAAALGVNAWSFARRVRKLGIVSRKANAVRLRDKEGAVFGEYPSAMAAAEALGCSDSAIYDCAHKGRRLLWKYTVEWIPEARR